MFALILAPDCLPLFFISIIATITTTAIIIAIIMLYRYADVIDNVLVDVDDVLVDEKIIFCVTAFPFTVTLPDANEVVYFVTYPVEYAYVPLGSVNTISDAVECSVTPFSVTLQIVPLGNLLSVNVTLYVTKLNVTDSDTTVPLIVNDPDAGLGAYSLFPVATVYEYEPFSSLNVIVLVVDEYELPPVMFTYHMVLGGNPDSVNVTLYVTKLNVMDSDTTAPFTVNDPDAGLGAYSLFPVAILYEYVPFGSLNVIVLVVDECDAPPVILTYHIVPEGNPDSVNVTPYVNKLNVIDSDTAAPFTVNDPDAELGAYSLFPVAILYEYVPFGSLNVIVLVVDEYELPPVMFTYHIVPEGNPDSVNVIVYVT